LEIDTVLATGTEKLSDTLIYDPSQDELEVFRELSSFHSHNGLTYEITVRNLKVESENILIAIVISYIVILLLVFITLFYLNNSRNKRLWAPFFTNLERMKSFSLSSSGPIILEESPILEFTELKKELETLTQKVTTDYLNLKQFTENVSHELQTPLAIIMAKIDNIINRDDLTDTQFTDLSSIQNDIQRLTQLNKRLVLLTKIENRQFTNIHDVSLASLLEKSIKDFQEISPTAINFKKQNDILVKMDPYLASILCNNLLSNALKYHQGEDPIAVLLKGNTLQISNAGQNALKQPEEVFSRFYRESETAKSTGVGLAIVKRICELYNYKINYSFSEGQHVFDLEVNQV
jgi:signal transduction histidine kinase